MSVKFAPAIFTSLALAAYAPQSQAQDRGQGQALGHQQEAETVSDGSAWSPYPGTSKDREFLNATPTEFLPFVKACDPWDEWDKPAPPFKIYGNTYYVGTCGIAAILVTSDDGHILIDSGTNAGADIVANNIGTLGFKLADIRGLLVSHEHFDHAGGMAKLQRLTGADVYTSWAAAPVIRSGNLSEDDPQFGTHDPMAPVANVRSVRGGESGEIGGISIMAISTPGHTPGAMSWAWQSCEDDICLDMVYADSLSPVSGDDYKFSDYPDYLAAYEAGLERLARVDCSILLTPHPSHSRMLKRMRHGTLTDQTACAYYAIGKFRDLEKRLKQEGVQPDAQ